MGVCSSGSIPIVGVSGTAGQLREMEISRTEATSLSLVPNGRDSEHDNRDKPVEVQRAALADGNAEQEHYEV